MAAVAGRTRLHQLAGYRKRRGGVGARAQSFHGWLRRCNEDEDAFAVHHDLILRNGVFNLEFMTFETLLADEVYEFLFVFTPLRLKGATGSPGRPLAIR